MRRKAIRGAPGRALASVALAAFPGALAAQEAPADGPQLTFGIETELRAHDNRALDPVSAGETVRSDTRLSFGFSTATPLSVLSLSGDAVVRAQEAPGTGFTTGIVTPGLALSYTREGANARFTFGASLETSEVDGFRTADDGTVDATDLIRDTGTRYVYGVTTSLETGLQAPLGFSLDLRHRGTVYDDTSDPDLFDSITTGGTAGMILRFSPVTVGRVTLGADRYDAEDAARTLRDTYSLGFGLTHDLSATTVIDTRIGGRVIDDSVEGTITGADGRVTLSHDLPRGAISLTLETEQTVAGRRDRAEVERRFDFPLGAVTASLGAVNADGIDPQPVGSLAWSHEFAMGTFTTGLSHDIGVNSDADVQRTTLATLGLSLDLTAVSSVAFNADFAYVDGAGTSGVTETGRGSFGATYRHALTEDWALSAGYKRRYLDESGAGAAWDNAVFVTLGRSFSLLP